MPIKEERKMAKLTKEEIIAALKEMISSLVNFAIFLSSLIGIILHPQQP